MGQRFTSQPDDATLFLRRCGEAFLAEQRYKSYVGKVLSLVEALEPSALSG